MRFGWGFVVRLVVATLILHLVLIQPNHPDAATWEALFLFALELPVIIALLLALPGRANLFRALLMLALTVIFMLKVADFATFVAYNRGFNPATDMGLIDASWRLLSGSIGVPLAALVAIVAAFLPLVVAALIWWATGQWARVEPPVRIAGWWRGGFAVVAVLAGAVALGQIGQAMRLWTLPFAPPGAAFTARLAYERVVLYRTTMRDLATFTAAAQNDPYNDAAPLLDLIGGRDVLILFVESYGRTSFENPLYAPTHLATLAAAEAALAEYPDIAVRSGWLTAPMVGGQSWLAHSSVASGLWISGQSRYRTLIASPRRTLFQIATDAGYHSATLMPAVTYDWPEGPRMGFETILASGDLGYAGLPFNWVTMPDQFTLAAYDRLLRARPRERPLFTQIALISSHAPWVPVPEMIAWEDLGDGTVFNEIAQSGEPPDVVWRDRDRVREQYRLAIDYSLQAVMSYALRQVDDMPLLIILGDHQTANFVSQNDSFDVPIHVIGPAEVVAHIEGWGWTRGMVPDPDLNAWPMDKFRDRFLAAFSSGAPEGMRYVRP